ncbi:hypothetical protein F4819DRAFT_464451, partial [Hypoxylon fuscum]
AFFLAAFFWRFLASKQASSHKKRGWGLGLCMVMPFTVFYDNVEDSKKRFRRQNARGKCKHTTTILLPRKMHIIAGLDAGSLEDDTIGFQSFILHGCTIPGGTYFTDPERGEYRLEVTLV